MNNHLNLPSQISTQGMVFDLCGSSCPKTCTGREYNCEDHHCIDGCHCPDDMYMQDGYCVTKNECPCTFGNKVRYDILMQKFNV